MKRKGFNSVQDRIQLTTFECTTMKLSNIQNRKFHNNNKAKFKFGFHRIQIMKCTYYFDVEMSAKNKTLVAFALSKNTTRVTIIYTTLWRSRGRIRDRKMIYRPAS